MVREKSSHEISFEKLSHKRASVLILVRYVSVSTIIREYLKIHGGDMWIIVEIPSPANALRFLKDHRIDIVIADGDLVYSGPISGQPLPYIAKPEKTGRIMVLSSLREFCSFASVRKLGVDAILYKPFDLKELGRICFEWANEIQKTSSKSMTRPSMRSLKSFPLDVSPENVAGGDLYGT